MFGTLLVDFGAYIAKEAIAIGADLAPLAVKVEGAVVGDVEKLFTIGAPLAVAAVKKYIPLVMSGQLKFSNAVVDVWQALEAKIGPVAMQDVHMLIQLSYNGLKAEAQKLGL